MSAHDTANYDGYSATWIWWLEHGLDGIAGGLIAVVGVAGTLWYDRHARTQSREHQELDEARQVVGRVLEKALDANSQVNRVGASRDGATEAMSSLDREIRLATPHLYRAGITGFAASLQMHGAVIALVMSREDWREDAGRVAFGVTRRCQGWLRDPAGYNGDLHDRAEARSYGDTVLRSLLHPQPITDEPVDGSQSGS